MDDQRFGAALRAVRQRREWRQIDLASRSGTSQSTISRVERGHLGSLSMDTIRTIAAVMDIRVDLMPRWRAGDLDRLLSARHSRLHEAVARSLARYGGWAFTPELSFSIYGERGVIDMTGWNEPHRAMLLIELKTDIVDVNELLGTFDRKVRLGPSIAQERGWDPVTVSGWVIVAASRTNRLRIASHRQMLRAAFPKDGRTMGGWLRDPVRRVSALSVWPPGPSEGGSFAPIRRVRKRDERPRSRV